MARTDTLGNFLTDVADAIREKKGTSETIQASDFDTEIENLPSGGDISEYFNTVINLDSSSIRPRGYGAIIKKIPEITITDNVVNLDSFFQNLANPIKLKGGKNITYIPRCFSGGTFTSIDLSEFEGNSLTGIYNMFSNCTKVEKLDLKTFLTCDAASFMFDGCTSLKEVDISNLVNSETGGNMSSFFRNCTALEKIDMRKFTFGGTGNYSNFFQNVPSNCLIIVKSQTEKDWILTQRSDFTNVKTVEEYEAQ